MREGNRQLGYHSFYPWCTSEVPVPNSRFPETTPKVSFSVDSRPDFTTLLNSSYLDMFGSQPPQVPPFYSPGTPQPEWQQAPANQNLGPPWQATDHGPPPPLPPPPPGPQSSASSYNPGTYGPMPGAGASPSLEQNIHSGFSPVGDTSSWGVRYNHQQAHQRHQSSFHGNQSTGPPLPPRPSSALDHSQSQSQPSAQAAPWSAPAPASTSPLQSNQHFYPQTLSMNTSEPHTYYQQQQGPWQTFQDPNPTSSQQIPPPPPPVPPAYQAEQQQIAQGWASQPPYSEQVSNHHYDPVQQPPPHSTTSSPPVTDQYGPAGGGMYGQPQTTLSTGFSSALLPLPDQANAYTSPLTPTSAASATPQSPPVVSTASALGLGGPSDWEHFSVRQEEIDDTAAFNFKTDVSPKKTNTFELPSDPPPRTLSGRSNQAQTQGAESSQGRAVPEFTRKPSPSPPISPHIPPREEPDNPPPLIRADSMASSIISTDESTIIDGVIQAWSNPVPTKVTPLDATQAKENTSSSASSHASGQSPVQSPPTPRIQSPNNEKPQPTTPKAEQAAPRTIVKVVDLYEDLDPWYKSSLSRYVAMLRKEMAAESDEERFKMFTHFLNKEAKLREILYGVEDTSTALYTNPMRNLSVRNKSVIIPELNTSKLSPPLEDGDDVVTYSPGGRPILASALSHSQSERTTGGDGLHRSASHPTPPLQSHFQHTKLTSQDGFGAISTGSPISNFPRSVSVPPGATSAVPRIESTTAFLSQPTRPAYTPFRYAEGPQRGSGPLTFDRPAFQAYSALRQASVSSGRTLAHPAAGPLSPASVESPSLGKAEHGETFIGLIREKSVAYRGRHKSSDPHTKSSVETSLAGNQKTIFDGLREILPTTLPNPAANPDVIELRKELEAVQGDFNFIQESISGWDEQARIRRPELDRQRRVRQEESEHHIDGLFNDKEIGYSDINVLEDEFRQTEAQRQLTEERKELESYLENVFNPIESRLKDDICRLQAQYDRAVDMLNADTAASDLLPGSPKTTKYELSHVMQIAVELFQKLEVRYNKKTEAILERERRRKKAERRYYVFLGESSLLKQLDNDFDAMEKRNILDAAREKDSRANTLMDSFDDASMRGLGENQSVLDDIAGKVKRINTQYLNSLGQLPADTEQIMASALAFVKYLGADSESILQSFGAADQSLNDADYDVSVSEARVSNADPDIFHRLDEEKKKEDVKIHDDLQARLDSVRMGHEALMANLREALNITRTVGFSLPTSNPAGDAWRGTSSSPMAPIAEGPVPAPAPSRTPPGHNPTEIEDEQQQRHRKALEDAKRRNAAKGVIP
ncbi:hypothetical protein AJ78_05569 [Emergomyces pasteurianus Ep9510]|uniref:Uncharacterized protein n=1 Tax=Emergomyces pasteurianus Ep9510 TaxID=1447872 RepID=A0A1J9QD66_9EURO|nr:hypothetical protein AJ78_05569 [Emergomyces pasteurianus Ep9510]